MSRIQDVDDYARKWPQFDDDVVPPLLERYLAARKPPTILDAGCGEGSLVRALVRRKLVSERVLACDASSVRIARLDKPGTAVTAFVDDVEKLENVDTSSIDFFVSSQVIEHVDDERMLHTVARVTRPGGLVYL
ncbi:hypothetical protein AKJ09_09762 [Labilithrix luteola]|uniref:Methyltransferase type 11 domain-containing protein n=1 Tax=Labilithrix luteola TaxID=1391654 RepID=A0A0K1QBH4_9BACT|nr:class I SAM-dependent methyltransferase [Labilithrix luteola]AKV03099.1 hypothetical protein AKJ09_09762 [Labilithrix luteola]